VYAVSVMGTTGERDRLATSAAALATRVKQVTDLPVLLGFGISTPEQAAEAAAVADGVIVGAAVMRRILDGAGPAEVGAFVASLRAALSGPVAVR
jgi:tryptophan synthase alpha chain